MLDAWARRLGSRRAAGLDPATAAVIKCGPMATPARHAANRQNALRSTGPRTAEGKAVACQNARTHGLLSRQVLLPDENKARLIALGEHFLAELAPVGELETLLVERIIVCTWRLRRLHRVEAEVFDGERVRLREAGLAADLGAAFGQASHTLSTLARYEAARERAFYRALHELQRLQAVRAGQAVPPPLAVDVDVSVAGPDSDEEA